MHGSIQSTLETNITHPFSVAKEKRRKMVKHSVLFLGAAVRLAFHLRNVEQIKLNVEWLIALN
jgi:hypothetical protein